MRRVRPLAGHVIGLPPRLDWVAPDWEGEFDAHFPVGPRPGPEEATPPHQGAELKRPGRGAPRGGSKKKRDSEKVPEREWVRAYAGAPGMP